MIMHTPKTPSRHFTRHTLALTLSLPLTLSAYAQVAPSSGQLMQEVTPAMPLVEPARPALKIEAPAAHTPDNSVSFKVQKIQIVGNTRFDTATLHALVADQEGRELSLTQLNALAARITDYYRQHGYLVSRAYIPAQQAHDATVRIAVLEARYGTITLSNDSRVHDHALASTLAPLHSGDLITLGPLDRSLLLLGDVPGLSANGTLSPGTAVGTSDLQVHVADLATFTGDVGVDNYGNRYTGRPRFSSDFSINNPLHQGDQLSFNGLTEGSGMNYGRMAYQYPLTGNGLTLGASVSALDYRLNQQASVAELGANGNAQQESLWLSQAMVRSRTFNVWGQIQYTHQHLNDLISVSGLENARQTNDWTLGLSGNLLAAGSSTSANFGLTTGRLGFGNDAAQAIDQQGANLGGNYTKWSLNLSHVQQLASTTSLYLSFAGQAANKNLDPSEQFILGGPTSVRAYDLGAVVGAQGYQATAELRQTLPFSWGGLWQATAFFDNGFVQVNHNVYADGANTAILDGAGVGLNWYGPHAWVATAALAAKVGPTPVLVADASSVRLWLRLQKTF